MRRPEPSQEAVERFTSYPERGGLIKEPEGNLVYYSDYADLRAEYEGKIEIGRREIDALRERLQTVEETGRRRLNDEHELRCRAEAEVEHEKGEKHKLIEAVGDIEAKRREAEAEVEALRGQAYKPVDYVCDDCGHRWKQPEVADSYVPCPSCGKPSGALV